MKEGQPNRHRDDSPSSYRDNDLNKSFYQKRIFEKNMPHEIAYFTTIRLKVEIILERCDWLFPGYFQPRLCVVEIQTLRYA